MPQRRMSEPKPGSTPASSLFSLSLQTSLTKRCAQRYLISLLLGLALTGGTAFGWAQQVEPAKQLVREVSYNEMQDHERHGNWRYWVKQRLPEGTRLVEQVETHEGTVTRVMLRDERPLDEQNQSLELARLDALSSSSAEQQSRREAYAEDEKRVGRLLAILPDAFLFEEAGGDAGCRHLRFRPDPAYAAHTIEARVFHAISGELWIDTRMKRVVKLEGHLGEDLNFGFGLLGKLNKGSWFRMDRTQVSATEWRTNGLEVHISGRAVVFKALDRELSESRGGFVPLPAGLTLSQGARLLTQASTGNAEASANELSPARWSKGGR